MISTIALFSVILVFAYIVLYLRGRHYLREGYMNNSPILYMHETMG